MSTVALDNTTPLLEVNGGSGRWIEEAKNQVCFALPMILTNLFFYLITLVSVMFAGHHGNQLHLAAATLANSWAFVSGFCFMGLWIGLICGHFCQAGALLVITLMTEWNKIDVSAETSKAPLDL